MNVQELVSRIDSEATLPEGTEERFSGYGIMGVPFRSGHVLALRHFPASSVGPGYTSVWHRDPEGVWDFYANVPPQLACTRFFGSAVARAIRTPVQVLWTGRNSFRISIAEDALEWEVRLKTTPTTEALNRLSFLMPQSLWKNTALLKAFERMAGRILQAGNLSLRGIAPNGQQFKAIPQQVWLVAETRASIHHEDLGPPGPLPQQAHIGDFWIPQKGFFVVGQAYFESFNPHLHHLVTHIRTRLN